MKKYADLFQIGEVAALLSISRSMLLNYENNRLIKPTLVDSSSGYRYFDCSAIARIQLILDLRKSGMSINEIEQYLSGKLPLQSQIEKINEQIAALQNMAEQLELRSCERGHIREVKEITVPERHCICKSVVADDVDAAINAVKSTYNECLTRKLHFSDGGYHFCEFQKPLSSENFYETENIKMRVCICIDKTDTPEDAVIFPATKALSVSFCGSYAESIIAYKGIKTFMEKNNYEETGYPQELYLEGNFDNSFDNNIVWIIVPVKKCL